MITLSPFLSLVNSYGDMPAHNLLWRECDKTSGDVAARLAAIPLVQVFVFYLLSINSDITVCGLRC